MREFLIEEQGGGPQQELNKRRLSKVLLKGLTKGVLKGVTY